MVTDPIADFITQIKNGSAARKAIVSMPYSAFKESVAHVLMKAGYLVSVEKKGKKVGVTLEVGLAYIGGNADDANAAPRVQGVDRVSKPSRRVYQKSGDIRVFKSGFGNTVFSTPKGIFIDADAKKQKVGGEVLFKIW
ncbi:MAG: ribosomal protein small subunit ribosomal protein [Candidatus Taylorbacteria bacterium]|nr:ribosomal protein small subunit ribosomal protein [Candidatus Taylorbacteria bacterium]